MSQIQYFPPFDPDYEPDSVGLRWEDYKRDFVHYMVASNKEKFADIEAEIVTSSFIYLMGKRCANLFRTVGNDTDKYVDICTKMDKVFVKSVNTDYEKYKFSLARQSKNESFDAFINRLRILSANCGFSDADAEIRTRIIQGCYSEPLRVKALSENLNAENLIKTGRAMEHAKSQAHLITEAEIVHSIRDNKFRKPTISQYKKHESVNRSQDRAKPKKCGYCGNEHIFGKNNCPAYGKRCDICKLSNHSAAVCRSKNQNAKAKDFKGQNINAISHVNESGLFGSGARFSNESSSEYIFSINCGQRGLPTVDIEIDNNSTILMYIDTCCTLNVIDENTYNRLKVKPKLTPVENVAWGYQNERPIDFLGEFLCKLTCKSKIVDAKISVIRGKEKCLLGFHTCDELGIVKIINSVAHEYNLAYWKAKYPSVFSGKLGKLKDFEVKLDIDETVKPVVCKRYPLPFHIRGKVEEIVQQGVAEGVFEKATGPTTWLLNPFLVDKGGGKKRFVVDASPTNDAIRRTRHQLPTIEELIADINGSKVFSKLDLKDGFHQVSLHEESRHVTTFRAPSGLYRYTRLLQGNTAIPEIYHNIIETQVIQGLEGSRNVMDDLLVHGKDDEEHDRRLDALLKRLNDKGLTVNINKCRFKQKSVEFFGLIFSEDGIRLTFDKTQALRDAKTPKSPGEISSLLGLSTYCSRFIKDHATITDPLRQLTRKRSNLDKSPMSWGVKEENALKALKEAATGEILAYFDVKYDTVLIVDASPIGLGAILMQTNPKDNEDVRIIAYASRSLSDVERRYSQLEKECLAMVYGCEKFHIYLYGRKFLIDSDAKALEYIFNKRNKTVPVRIERWSLRLMPYDFRIRHRPGIGNPADYLSRQPVFNQDSHKDDVEEYVNYVFSASIPKSITHEEILKATNEDEVLQELIRRIRGAKFNLKKRKSSMFDHVFHELCVTDENIVMRKQKIVIPLSLQERVISIAHEGHQGITKTKELLRTKVWFPRLDALVEKKISSCHTCQINHPTVNYEPLRMTGMPNGPWENVDIDFYGPTPDGTDLLVLIDQYSRFAIVEEVKSKTAQTVIPVLHKIWSTFGIPLVLKSDNGPRFSSVDFSNMCGYFGIKHHLITPYWPRANGEVERFNRNLT